MTVAVVAKFCGRELVLDEPLEARIAEILRSFMGRFPGADFDAVRAANRKQALVPAGDGVEILDPVGTAPGVVVTRAGGGPTVMVLPGPPRELQPMWTRAIETATAQRAVAGRTIYRQDTIRMFGLPESGLAETLREAETLVPGFAGLEITTCLRRGELEIVTRHEPDAAESYRQLAGLLRERHPHDVFSEDGSLVDDQVAQLLSGRTIATAESCTAGLLAARLADRPGSSAYLSGGVVSYSERGQGRAARCGPRPHRHPRRGIRTGCRGHGGRGPAALRRRASPSVSPGSPDRAAAATKSRSAQYVSACVWPTARRTPTIHLPGNRADIRERSTTVAMHMLRRVLGGATG